MLSPLAQSKFAELSRSDASAAVVTRLSDLVDRGSDFDLYKINAFRLAHETGAARTDAVRTLLFATKLGIFDLTWDIHCPSCKGVPEYHRHLMGLARRAHCPLCEIDWTLDLEEQVEVTFTVNAEVRRIDIKEFADRVFPEHMELFRTIGAREGRAPIAGALLSPGEAVSLECDLTAGEYVAYVPSHLELGARVHVRGEPETARQVVSIDVGADGGLDKREVSLRPGPARLDVRFGYGKLWGFGLRAITPERNWVSAAYVTSQQDFRDLFSGEFLSEDASFAVRAMTLMFTDIKGSTEMYETLGDGRAYAIVKAHFRLMADVIRAHEGGIVKTIGDAVMASFPSSVDAVRAACAIQIALGATGDPLRDVEVKIGIHRGPVIAVTSNRALDFFGRTVNIAARVQSQAKPNEVLMTDGVLADPSVRQHVAAANLAPRSFVASVKGVAQSLTLHAITAR